MVSVPWFELAPPISRLMHERGGLRCPAREEDHPSRSSDGSPTLLVGLGVKG